MIVLGLSGGIRSGNQDGAAALIQDGHVIAAAEEERFTRMKHASGSLPLRAIHYCLLEAGITIQDVDTITFPGETYRNFTDILSDYFDFHFGHCPNIKLLDHHRSHAASAYYCWDQDPALILTMDFSGDGMSTLAAVGEQGHIRDLYRIPKPNSLGVFYSLLTQYLGFEKDNDEYKVMGLSAFGDPNQQDLSQVLHIEGDHYRLNTDYLKLSLDPSRPSPSKQERLYTRNLSLAQRGRLNHEPITPDHYNIAACGQKVLEDVVLHLIKQLVQQTGIRSLCLAGGVALNCAMNRRIKESGLVDRLYVPPHVSDAGLSIGSAQLHCSEQGIMPLRPENFYLGPSYTDEDIRVILDKCHLPYTIHDDIEERAAQDIDEGKIVGWFQGRMEFGPRALGNRSILADPRDPKMTDKINALVKFRESFRPFAPSVLQEKAAEYFVDVTSSPYMTITHRVQPDKYTVVPAITHVNGTARIQTVSQESNSRFYRLIQAFEKRTGVPMVLNTSLNVMGQPMVCAPRQAIETFYGTGLHALAMGSFYLSK